MNIKKYNKEELKRFILKTNSMEEIKKDIRKIKRDEKKIKFIKLQK